MPLARLHSSLPATTFQEWIQQLPPAEKRLIADHTFAECDAEQALLQYLQLPCTLLVGTDGGKKHHAGSFSWILCAPSKEQLILNSGPADGWHRCHSSLRSEAAAIASLTLYVDELAAYHEIVVCCKFRLYVDSTAAISNVTTLRDLIPKRRFPNHADLLSTMSSAHYVIQMFVFTHVHSHQDDDKKFEDLPYPVQLNVLCDRMATAELKKQQTHDDAYTLSSPLRPRTLTVEVRHGQQVISAHYVARIREAIAAKAHRQFLQNKYKWTDQVWESVALEALYSCARKLASDQPATRSKIDHNWLNLGIQRAKFGTKGATTELERCCPYCRQPEDFTHLLTCPDPRALKFRYDASLPLRKAISSLGETGEALLEAIKAWTQDLQELVIIAPVRASEDVINGIANAMIMQKEIGWTNFFRGFVAKEWGSAGLPSTATHIDADEQSQRSLTVCIAAAQTYTLHIWTSRFAVLHESGSDSLDIVHAILNNSIIRLYTLQSTFSAIVQSYFATPLEDRLKQSPRQRKRWLLLTRLATSHSSVRGTRQQHISTYYPYAQNRCSEPAVTSRQGSASQMPPPSHTQQPITAYLSSYGG